MSQPFHCIPVLTLVVIVVYSELSFAVGFGVFLKPQETASKKRRSSTVSLEGVMQELPWVLQGLGFKGLRA